MTNFKEKTMNVLSLFDGMSCGRIALERLGIPVDNYYASEIDKYAIKVSQANYPDIIQVGDVTELDTSTLPKIDLIMGGSPCQGFSFAGKQLAFDDPRSALFFEFVRCVKELKPKYFLLENVRMKKEYLDVISEYMGVEPIMINSALVSAQNRVRYYWTNIPRIEQPEQRGIVLRDILETNASNEYLAGENLQKNYKGGNQLNPNYKSQANTIHNADGKSGTICAGTHGYANGYVKDFDKNLSKMTTKDDKSFCLTANYGFAGAKNSLEKKQRTMIPTDVDSKYYLSEKAIEYMKKSHVNEWTKGKTREEIYIKNESQKSNTLTANMYKGVPYNVISVDKQKKQLTIKEATKKGYTTIEDGDCFDMTFPNSKTRRGRNMKDKSNCLTAANYDYMRYEHSDEDKEVYWRKLTPVECERLQTVPDNYTNHVSNTQRYKMLGNGWTIEVIAHILKNMEL
jgi:DNA (cytosine-5)-methyltransferase 3A